MTITAILPARTDVSAYRAEDAIIASAREVLEQATRLAIPGTEIAITALEDAICLHEALRAGVLGWEEYDPGLSEYAEHARHDIAVRKSAEAAEEWSAYVAEQIEASGEQAANAAMKGES